MKITGVSTAVVEANFDYTFVRVQLDDGTYGIGECFFAPGLPAIARDVGTLLIGGDPRDIRTLTTRMHLAISASSGSGHAGAALHAVSGLETALWDLSGKIYGEPIWRILGGSFRQEIPVYADLHAGEALVSVDSLLRSRRPFWASDDGVTSLGDFYWTGETTDHVSNEAILKKVQTAADNGFGCVKLDIDVFEHGRLATDATLPSATALRLAESASWLRSETNRDVEIAYDCHWRFDIPTARALNGALAEAAPLWLEDPVPPSGRALAAVAEAGPIAIASGENAYRLEGIEELATHGGLHIATPDVQKVGGIREAQQIGDWCSRTGIGFAPHCIASPIGFMAAVHVMATIPSVMFLEFHGSDLPFWSDLVAEEVIRDGKVTLPDRPGLGVTLNMDLVRQYSRPGEPVFEEGPAN